MDFTEDLLLCIFPTVSIPLYPYQDLFAGFFFSHSRLQLEVLSNQGVSKLGGQHEFIQENIYRLCNFVLLKDIHFALQAHIPLVFIIIECMCEKGTDVFSPHS